MLEVERIIGDRDRVMSLARVDGEPITPDEIVKRIAEIMP